MSAASGLLIWLTAFGKLQHAAATQVVPYEVGDELGHRRLRHCLRPDDRIWLIEYMGAMATAPPCGVPT